MLDRIAKVDPALRPYARVTPERALAQAEVSEAEIAADNRRGPVHGVPIAVNDIRNTAGVVTTACMTIHADTVPDRDATVGRTPVMPVRDLLGRRDPRA
jgi:amidase